MTKNQITEKNLLARLEEKQQALNARIQSIKAKEKLKDKKQDTRFRILLGAFSLHELKEKSLEERNLIEEKLVIYYTKERDQDLIHDYFKKLSEKIENEKTGE